MGASKLSGALTSTNGFVGDLTGDVIGDVTGDVTGDITGQVLTANGDGVAYASEVLPIVASTASQDTTIVLPIGTVIEAIYLEVGTAEVTGTTKQVDIGVSGGDEDGLLDGVSVAATGVVQGTLLNSGQTLGALMSVDEDGAGALVPQPYVCAAETTIAYSLAAADYEEMVARVIVKYSIIGIA